MIATDARVDALGLCNFDTEHMEEIVQSGVRVVSNQVQVRVLPVSPRTRIVTNNVEFSLIDLRPTFKMAACCRKHDVKLLTYGSLVRLNKECEIRVC